MFELKRSLRRVSEALQLDQLNKEKFRVRHDIQLTADVLRQLDTPVPFNQNVHVTGNGDVEIYTHPTDANSELLFGVWSVVVSGTFNFCDISIRRWIRKGYCDPVHTCQVYLYTGQPTAKYDNCARGIGTAITQVLCPSFWMIPGDVLTAVISSHSVDGEIYFQGLPIERKIKY